jgi:hypothetical protein
VAAAVTAVAIRSATSADAPALRRLAALDSSPCPVGRLLVADVDGEIRAALDRDVGVVIADPFRRTVELVDLLRLRARQLAPPPANRDQRLPCARRHWPRMPRSIATRTA